METTDQDNKVDIVDLRREVIEMRDKIPCAYRAALEKDFERFKERLTNVLSEKNALQYMPQPDDDVAVDIALFNETETQQHNKEDLQQYIRNAEKFVNNLEKVSGKKKNKVFQ